MKIYLATHLKYTFPNNDLYVPIQCGAAIHPDLGYLKDNSGDNISWKNKYYCELTAYYWVWKNVHDQDIVGIGHYRRIPGDMESHIYTEEKLREEMTRFDAITNCGMVDADMSPAEDVFSKGYNLNNLPENSTYGGYCNCHKKADIDLAWEAIRLYYPEYEKDFVNYVVFGSLLTCCNILIAKKDIFDSYCEWLFNILFYVEERSNYLTYDDYNQRVFGFLAERLEALYFVHNKIDTMCCTTINLEEENDNE